MNERRGETEQPSRTTPDRRTVLGAVAGGVTVIASASLAGCLSRGGVSSPKPTDSPPETTRKDTQSPMRRTAVGVTASFRVTDGHAPTEETASASFSADSATVTGSMDPNGCNRPILESVVTRDSGNRIEMTVGGKSPYGETATVECGNASYDYECVLSFSESVPSVVEVIHSHADGDEQTFRLERE